MILGYPFPFFYLNGFYLAIAIEKDLVRHFHGFQEQDGITLLHFLPDLGVNLNDGTGDAGSDILGIVIFPGLPFLKFCIIPCPVFITINDQCFTSCLFVVTMPV